MKMQLTCRKWLAHLLLFVLVIYCEFLAMLYSLNYPKAIAAYGYIQYHLSVIVLIAIVLVSVIGTLRITSRLNKRTLSYAKSA